MSIEITLLFWATALTFVQTVVAAIGKALQHGLPAMVGNREGLPSSDGWVGRAERAQSNMLENMVPFAGLVLIAHLTGNLSDMTALGAQLFFWARLAYAAIYVVGISWARTAVFILSLAGMALIFIELIKVVGGPL